MLAKIKRLLYFPIAHYFRFFAQIQLRLWHPRIILITGSSGKTTLLHLFESQLGSAARYSHHANSAFGIPFDILGLKRTTLTKDEWLTLLLMAPFQAFKTPAKEKLYIVEADCDRPGEGDFLGTFLKPEVTLWLNATKSHSMNFPAPIEQSVAQEFGYFIEHTTKLAIINGDSTLIQKQLSRTKAEVVMIKKSEHLQKYQIGENRTQFIIDHKNYSFKFLLPEETFYSIAMCLEVVTYLSKEIDVTFSDFQLPPGRSSIFKGIKQTTLIDSSYNANLSSMQVILEMFDQIPAKNKWVVLGDMIEQGTQEQSEHEKLATVLADKKIDRIVLMGPRISRHTYPKLRALLPARIIIEQFLTPKEVLDYLLKHLQGKETVLFKGARFLEGVIEQLLEDKKDSQLLCRRELIWQQRRKEWGL